MGDSGLDAAAAGEADLLAALMASFRKELDSILCSTMLDLLSSEEEVAELEENPVEWLVMSLLLPSLEKFSSFSLLLSSLQILTSEPEHESSVLPLGISSIIHRMIQTLWTWVCLTLICCSTMFLS